ncbi:hypothetical protein B0T10DRAFT_466474 [Thelonectria olida]|uniref:Transcription factor domain-containing protein n=1 Tax=Thelonectria olida TaxID=1576542 RepID=A0A9P9AF58_9HYPO|nr:hypothetical protein B0T10DRAFT_466474 [Thelonectria olida]
MKNSLGVDLGLACAAIYSEHIYFEVPVLDCSSLCCSVEDSRAPFSNDSLLHYALMAAAAPWLGDGILSRCGLQNRQEGFESSVHGFEACLGSSVERDPFEETQALLIMVFALSQISTRAMGRKQSQWLRLAIKNLHKMSPSPAGQNSEGCAQSRSRLWKRLWWSGFIMEQLHFLRHSLEEPAPFYPSRFGIDPRSMQPLLLEDFDLGPSRKSGFHVSEYWNCMQRASCFIERAALCELVARYARDRPRKTPSMPPPSSLGQINHDDDFWKIEATVQRFVQFRQDTRFYSAGSYINDDGQHIGLLATRVRLDMVFFRIMIALYRRIEKQNDNYGHGSTRSMWYRLRDERIAQIAREVLATSKQLLDRTGSTGPSFGAGVEVLRAITVTAGALLSLKTWPLDYQRLLWESQALLETCFDASCTLWTECAAEHHTRSSPPPPLTYEVAEGASAAFNMAETPRDDAAQSCALVEDVEWLEKKRLLSDFDEMWNTTDMKLKHTFDHPPGAAREAHSFGACALGT